MNTPTAMLLAPALPIGVGTTCAIGHATVRHTIPDSTLPLLCAVCFIEFAAVVHLRDVVSRH